MKNQRRRSGRRKSRSDSFFYSSSSFLHGWDDIILTVGAFAVRRLLMRIFKRFRLIGMSLMVAVLAAFVSELAAQEAQDQDKQGKQGKQPDIGTIRFNTDLVTVDAI